MSSGSWQAMSDRARLADGSMKFAPWWRSIGEKLFDQAPPQEKVIVGSQGGAGAGAALSVTPMSSDTTLPFHFFSSCCDRPSVSSVRTWVPMWPFERRL